MVKRLAIDNILCATDCSDASVPAMRRAVSLGRWFRARVTVLHVTPALPPPETGMTWAGYVRQSAEEVDAWRRQQREAVDAFVAPYLGRGVPIATCVAAGASDAPSREIREAAETLAADLIVMGTHQRTGLDHFLLGSVAEKVLRVAPCPVMVVAGPDSHDTATPLFRRIVCATDLGEGAQATVNTALSLAQENLARLVLLHVVEDVRDPGSLDLYRPVPEPAAFRQALVERAQRRLGELSGPAPSFCDLETRVEMGKPWQEVVRVAEEEDADLIVLGAHAGGAIGRLFLGSPANQIVRHAPCPVLIAHEGPAGVGALSMAETAAQAS